MWIKNLWEKPIQKSRPDGSWNPGVGIYLVVAGLLWLCLGPGQTSLFAQDGLIKIAFYSIEAKFGVEAGIAETTSEFIRSEIIKTQAFQVIERRELDKLLKEQNMQLTDITEGRGVDIGRISNVRQLLLGSMGKLYDKIITSLRLVDIESGTNLFAETIYSTEDRFLDDLRALVYAISEKAIYSQREVTLGDIELAIKKRLYEEAQKLFEILRTKKHNINLDTLQALRNKIIKPLAEEYRRKADDFRRLHYYIRAYDYINKAIAQVPDEKYFKFRERVLDEKRQYEQDQAHRQELASLQAEEKQRKRYMEVDQGTYFEQLTTDGQHLAVTNQWAIDDNYQFPSFWGNWGVEYLAASAFKKKKLQLASTDFLCYFGMNGSYIQADPYKDQIDKGLIISAYFSPFISQGIKLVNFNLLFGVDVGGTLLFNNQLENNMAAALTCGLLFNFEIKLFKGIGIFAGTKIDYLYFPTTSSLSGWNVRALSGVVF